MSDESPIPHDETQRLAALRSYRVLDTAPEAEFDDLTRLLARHFGVPTVLVSLIDESRQWFKSRFGLDIAETPREMAFCAHTILDDRPLIVCDARCDPRFRDNPFVTGAPHIRFYAGAPLITSAGLRLGSLCLIDDKAWSEFSPSQEEDLVAFAVVVMERLEARRRRLSAAGEIAEPGVADTALEEAVAQLAHEFLTPLAEIVGHAEIIERQHGRDDDLARFRHYARHIGDIGRYVCELAQRTLDAASLRNGEIKLQEDWLTVSDVAGDVEVVLTQCAERSDVAIDIAHSDLAVSLFADRLRLQQMLLNLLGNAIKFTPPGGRIELRARQTCNGGLDLTVSDNGPGMTSEETRRALQPYARIRRHGDAKIDGFGLGLPMTRRLVELHGGNLLIDSVKGGGTAVTLRFPPDRLQPAAASAAETVLIEMPQHLAV